MNKPGTLNVVYFVRSDGWVTLAPYTNIPESLFPDSIKMIANTLPEVDRLQKRIILQEKEKMEREGRYEEETFGAYQQIIRDKMYARMCSSASTQWEKDFIREWFKLKNEQKKVKYSEIFEHTRMFFHAREFDTPGRRSDSEEFHPDRIEVKT